MIDIHTHMLPGIDDGSKDINESLALLREQVKQGINEVVFTPHFYAHEVSPEQFINRRNNAWNRLQEFWDEDFPIVHFGAEVLYFNGMGKVEAVKDLCIDSTNLMLLEMPYSKWTSNMIDDMYELMDRQNIRIIMAHIERCLFYQPKEIYYDLLDRGVIMQSNVDFFVNWKTKHKAKKLFKNGMIHAIASDCHNMSTRLPNLIQCKEYYSQVEMNLKEMNVIL